MAQENQMDFTRNAFGENFSFGAATSAYQIEGAWNVGGKGMSNWDSFTLKKPGGVADGNNGCVAVDHYNRFKEDVALMKKLGFNSYRFSISWTRILPGGKLCAGLCKEGIKFYNDLIDELVAAGIERFATLFHWDVPQCLEEEYGGFLSDKIVNDFGEFADVCFWNFGDRVKHWITLNEPWSFASQGYASGHFPPNRGVTKTISSETTKKSMFTIKSMNIEKSRTVENTISLTNTIALHRTPTQALFAPVNKHSIMKRSLRNDSTNGEPDALRNDSTNGDPGIEPYKVAHNLILAHAHAVRIYRQKYQVPQKGKIGMTNVAIWYEPLTDDPQDEDASSRALDFVLGWFLNPIVNGDYPDTMKLHVGNRLPKIEGKEKDLVKGSYDFLGINYYTSTYAKDVQKKSGSHNYVTDSYVLTSYKREDGSDIGHLSPGTVWLRIYPQGIYKLLMDIKRRYGPEQDIYITENGATEKNDKTLPIADCLSDYIRINYHRDHLYNIKQAMNDGVNVKGYFIWSLFDNFEWAEGYNVRFGIFYVDFVSGNLTRYPKKSAICWMNFLANNPDPWIREHETKTLMTKEHEETETPENQGTIQAEETKTPENIGTVQAEEIDTPVLTTVEGCQRSQKRQRSG